MIQKITLEIQNDTGLEFEEAIELRPLRHGDYWFNGHDKIVGPIDGDYGARRHVLTPKIDHELEDAKKLIGKWVRYRDRDIAFKLTDIAFKLTDVVRDSYSKEILGVVLNSIDSEKYYFKDLAPFPLPVWRCCMSDKPKKDGKYIGRRKNAPETYAGIEHFNNGSWDNLPWKECAMEWLDEGEL